MKHTESFNVTWTDGGNPGERGYFDGAGSMNHLLLCLFNGQADWHREGPPIGSNVMELVTYETRLRVTVTIEELE